MLFRGMSIGVRLRTTIRCARADDPATGFVAPEGAADDQIALQKSLLVSQVAEIRAKLAGPDRQIVQNQGNQAAVPSTISKITGARLFSKSAPRRVNTWLIRVSARNLITICTRLCPAHRMKR
jgi:hypothetical protein